MTRMRLPVALLAALAVSVFPQVASADLVSTTTSTVSSTTTINPITDWSTLLPTLAAPYNPNDPNNICNAGNPQCVQSVAREMAKRLQPLSDTCDHNALFALLYYDVTKQVYTAVTTPGYFQVPGVISHEDALFASYYFNAYDSYASGNLAATPVAWQIAFNAARTHEEQGMGNLLLGMNAHINRDLPFVLYRMGLFNSDGTSRKPDHDKVNQVLYDAYPVAISEGSTRFDPSTADNSPDSLGADGGIQTVIGWREEAWRNAERLAAASSDADRALIAQQIEAAATAEARTIEAAYAYPPGQTSASRDAYCAIHHNDS
jgi:hypothetical protein